MADGKEYLTPKGLARDIDKNKAQLDIKIPNLDATFLGNLKENCKVDHEFTENSFDIRATVTKDKVDTKFRYKVGKLPGTILPDKCSEKIKYKKEYIIVTLVKAEPMSWEVDIEHGALNPETE